MSENIWYCLVVTACATIVWYTGYREGKRDGKKEEEVKRLKERYKEMFGKDYVNISDRK